MLNNPNDDRDLRLYKGLHGRDVLA